MKDTTFILLASAVAFTLCTLGIVLASTITTQIFFGAIDLFIIVLFVFVSREVVNAKNS
jgi:voltage-gated potassium channel Kch